MKEILEVNGESYVSVHGGDCVDCCFNSEICIVDKGIDYRCSEKNFHWKEAAKELFTNNQYIQAVEQFLSFGEKTYNESHNDENGFHGGYFSGGGWAARCLRSLLEDLKEAKK